MRKLEEKMDMCSQCIDLYNQGKAEASKKDKEEKVSKDAFDKLINDTNKETTAFIGNFETSLDF